MRRVWLIGFSTMALAASLFAQGIVGGGTPGASGSDARIGAGGIGVRNPNILYPGSPSGGRPGSILNPGSPPTPAASPLPATPGTGMQERPREHDGRWHGKGRVFGRRGYLPVYGYGYGGVFIDSGSGPTAVEQENETATSSEANVITVPAAEPKVPRSRVFDVGQTADGRVTTRDYPAEGSSSRQAEYWLIALKGGLIYAADSFEERDDTFRFHTLEDKEFVVPLAEVDLGFTEKLNGDLGREFNLR
jgi:hypothetical protein